MIVPGRGSHAPQVITLIGGGGKTGLMFLWARSLKEQGYSVVTTSTTKLCNESRPGLSFAQPVSLAAAKILLNQPQRTNEIFTLTGESLPAVGKLSGIPADWVDQLSREFPDTIFLVEGDGSAGRSVKGHLPYEPVIPACTSLLIPIVGLDILGKAMNAENVHRPEVFSEITGVTPGDSIDTAAIITILLHAKGYLQQAPKAITIIPFLNKMETLPLWRASFALAQQLLAAKHPQINSILAGSIHHDCFVSFS